MIKSGYEVEYNINVSFNVKKVVRTTAAVTATVILTKVVMDEISLQLKPRLARLTKKLQMRAIDEAHKKAETDLDKK